MPRRALLLTTAATRVVSTIRRQWRANHRLLRSRPLMQEKTFRAPLCPCTHRRCAADDQADVHRVERKFAPQICAHPVRNLTAGQLKRNDTPVIAWAMVALRMHRGETT